MFTRGNYTAGACQRQDHVSNQLLLLPNTEQKCFQEMVNQVGNYNHIANHLRCKIFKCVMTLLSQFKLNYHHLHIDSQVKHPNKTLKSLMCGCCCIVNSYIVCLVEQANPYVEGAAGPLVGVPQAFCPAWHFFYFFPALVTLNYLIK